MSESSSTSRQKHLNVVYFVDSAKTRSVQIPLNKAKWAIAFVALVLIWTLSTTFASVYWFLNSKDLDKALRSSLSQILAYQIRYDQVFESAYPKATGNEKPNLVKVEPETAPIKQETATVAPKPDVDSDAVADEETTSSADHSDLKLSNIQTKSSAESYTVTFDMKNDKPGTKAEGYLWGIAKFETGGNAKFVPAPAHTRIDSNGNIATPSSSYRYSIRRFKAKDFVFKKPSADAKVEKITLYLSDLQGNNVQSLEVEKLPEDGTTTP